MNAELLDSYADLGALRKETDTFLSYLKELEAQYNKLKEAKISIQGADKIGPLTQSINTASTAFTGLATKIEQVNTSGQTLNTTAAQATTAAVNEAKAINQLSDSYDELVKASVQIQLSQKQLLADRKALDKAFKDGAIGEIAYLDGLKNIKTEQLALSRTSLEINNSLRNIGKAADAADGSLDKLRAELNLAQQAFKRLSAEEKAAALGVDLKTKIQGLTKVIKEQEQSVGLFQRNVGNYQSALGGFGDKIGGYITKIAAAGVALITLNSIKDFLSGAIEEFNQAELAATRFKGILDNMGRLDVLPRLTNEAEKLAKQFTYLDNDNIVEVFQKLVTFGKLTENQIKALTPVIIDFAAKQGISLEQSADVIIKALEGNGRALKEYGINIKDAKDTTEAFGLVMTELKPKVEGAAAAFSETLAGSAAKTQQDIANLKEEIGTKLAPVIKGFYAFLSEAINGIPQLFSGAASGIESFIDTIVTKVKNFGSITGALFSGGPQGALTRMAQLDAEADKNALILNQRKEIANFEKQAASIAADAGTKPLKEQERILDNNLAIQKASLDTMSNLVKAGKENTAEGKRAGAELNRNLLITKALRDVIQQTKDNSIIGGGNPDKPFTPGTSKSKTEVDLTNDVLAAAERERKMNEELNKLLISDDAAAQERILNNEKNGLDDRLIALEAYMKDKEALIHLDAQFELQNISDKLAKISEIESKPDNKRTTAEKKLLLDKQALLAQRVLIEAKAQSQETALAKVGSDKRLDILKSELSQDEKSRIDNFQSAKDADEAALNEKLINLNKEFEKQRDAVKGSSVVDQARVEEEFKNKRLAILEDYYIEALDKDIAFTEQTIALAKARGEDTAAAEKKLAAIRLQQSDLIVDHEQKNNGRIIKTGQERLEATKKTIDQVGELTNQLTNALGSAFNAGTVSKKNKIQEDIDLLQKKTQIEIDGINATTASEQDKAAKIAIVNARSAAQKEQLELRQRQLEERKARFEKGAQIAAITLAGIKATVAALGSIPYTPANIGLSIATGAIYLAQLAAAIATPIPKFKEGKGRYNDYEGLAIWGDGGRREMRITQEGKLEVSPNVPTVTYVNKTDVIHPDAEKYIQDNNAIALKKRPLEVVTNNTNNILDTGKLEKKLDRLTQVVSSKPTAIIRYDFKGWNIGYQQEQRYVQWVNRITG